MPVLQSPSFPFHHGFPTREGGVSGGPYASLNCGVNTDDRPDHVARNLVRLAELAQVAPGGVRTVHQVHGIAVAEAPAAAEGSAQVPAPFAEADGLVTAHAGLVLGIRTADCVPILLADEANGLAAAAHAGWRGTIDGVLSQTVAALVMRGAKAGGLSVVLGPHIRRCCFEVGREVAKRFESKVGSAAVVPQGDRYRVDLALTLRHELSALGVREVDDVGGCTSCDARYFSHRRDRGVTGRHLSFVRLAAR